MLKKRGEINGIFFIGEQLRVPLRVIALPVNQTVVNERRRKARGDRDRRVVPSKKRMFLLGWEIFLPNVEKEDFDPTDIAAIYFSRWRIETVFKCCKSYLKMNQVPKDGNLIRLMAFIYRYLIFIVWFRFMHIAVI